MNCYCGSGDEFKSCCQPFIEGAAKPATAEVLMRSRYSAFATGEVDYLLRTTHPSTRKFHDPESIRQWAENRIWEKLEIISVRKGSPTDKEGIVEFKALYLDDEHQPQTHHELSNFAKELGKWFFVDGKVI